MPTTMMGMTTLLMISEGSSGIILPELIIYYHLVFESRFECPPQQRLIFNYQGGDSLASETWKDVVSISNISAHQFKTQRAAALAWNSASASASVLLSLFLFFFFFFFL